MKTKLLLVTILSLLSNYTLAQFPTNMNEANMQQMMGALQEMAACYEKIDQQDLDALQQRSQKAVAEIQQLCSAGKRSQAQDKAVSYAKDMLNDKALNQIKTCAEKIPPSLKAMAQPPVDIKEYDTSIQKHVCDQQY